MSMQRGRFISVEGGEGAGKSTNIAFVRELLESAGFGLVVTREPGGTPLAEEIRSMLLQRREENISETTELLLMFAARMQHCSQVIEPALARGEWVLCDRFSDATLAYQGAGRGLDASLIIELQRLLLRDFAPDLTLLLDVPVARGRERVEQRGQPDRFEVENAAFFSRVRECYLDLARSEPQRFRVIDADRPLSEVQAEIRDAIGEFIARSDGVRT